MTKINSDVRYITKAKESKVTEKNYPYQILVKDKKTNKFLTLIYAKNQKKKYETTLRTLEKAQLEGKCEIIPQDTQEYIKTKIRYSRTN